MDPDHQPVEVQQNNTQTGGGDDVNTPQLQNVYELRKYLLLLATVVATVTYAAAFNPPGGAWQTSNRGYLGRGNSKGYLAGEPIIRAIHYNRYLVFFYCNTAAFVSSIVVILILILVLGIWHAKDKSKAATLLLALKMAMVCDLLGLMGAYAAGTSQDEVTTTNGWVLVVVFFVFVVILMVLWHLSAGKHGDADPNNPNAAAASGRPVLKEWHRKILMLLTTFISSNTYTSGLSTPGGFWGNSRGGHLAGDPVLMEKHPLRLKAFFFCNTIAFGMSLLITVLLMDKSRILRCRVLYGCITVALLSLVGAYAMGSCREGDNTFYVVAAPTGLFLACISLLVIVKSMRTEQRSDATGQQNGRQINQGGPANGQVQQDAKKPIDRARSLVALLATLVATVTYQAGLVPPGGVWQDNSDGHKAGNPILLSTNPERYKIFFYCNSMAFVVSLVVITLTQADHLFKMRSHALEVTMMLDLFGLIGAYAAGSCRDVSKSMIVIALAGASLVYVVIHVIFFTLDEEQVRSKSINEDKVVQKRRKMLLVLAVLGATLTYQAGLTPPGGSHQSGSSAGDPVLFHNYPRRYGIFFYSNSVSFMSSIALILLLVNPTIYKPGIRSYGLHACTVGVVGAYAAGSTQHMKTSLYIFGLVPLVLLIIAILLVIYYYWFIVGPNGDNNQSGETKEPGEAKKCEKQKRLMLVGVLAASITYQAGLNPPGGVWQDNSDGHAAGDPVMHDNHWHRYTAFFYCNSTSFVSSIAVIILLLRKTESLHDDEWLWLKAMDVMMLLNFLGLLGAYATGSTTEWEISGHVIALLVPALLSVAVQVLPPLLEKWFCPAQDGSQASQQEPRDLELSELIELRVSPIGGRGDR